MTHDRISNSPVGVSDGLFGALYPRYWDWGMVYAFVPWFGESFA